MISIKTPYLGEAYLRPTPFISITQNALRTERGLVGSSYDITLTGTILADKGSPFYLEQLSRITPPVAFQQNMKISDGRYYFGGGLESIIGKQAAIRELFRHDGFVFTLYSDQSKPILIFNGKVNSITFPEGNYVDKCDYTISITAEFLMDGNGRMLTDGFIASSFTTKSNYTPTGLSNADGVAAGSTNMNRLTPSQHMNQYGGFIENISESWSIEKDQSGGMTNTFGYPRNLPPTYNHSPDLTITSSVGYVLTRNLTVTGRQVWDENGKYYHSWQQAKRFLDVVVFTARDNNPQDTGYTNYPEIAQINHAGFFGSNLLNLSEQTFKGYNHGRSISIDEDGGSVTLTETWLLSNSNAYETYSMSINRDITGLSKVSITGNIKGLTEASAGGKLYGGSSVEPAKNTAYTNAVQKFHSISNDGVFGPNCHCFRRAQSLLVRDLNFVPLSIAVSPNEFTGEIGYTIEYDTRPPNYVSNTLQESVICSDTYPGDVFTIIPVIGRQTGPVLQYIGGRTEYQRSLSIDLTFDRYWYSGVPGWAGLRQFSATSKPSMQEPFASEIYTIVAAHSPANELGIRKYFVSPPQETWDAKTGKYTLNLTWTYEVAN